MLRRPVEEPAGLWMLNGQFYGNEVDYQAAVDKQDERRRRVLAQMAVRDAWQAAHPDVPWHGLAGARAWWQATHPGEAWVAGEEL